MSAARIAASLRLLRELPQWQLLAATKAAPVLAVLRAVLYEGDSVLPGSALTERVDRELDALRESGEDLPQTAQAYVGDWLRQGWLVRRLPEAASEETYELSADATAALRYVSQLMAPKTTATESRLATVIDQISKLAEETDAQPERRISALQSERDRIDREIAALRGGVGHTMPEERALERAREVIRLADELAGDFRRVRSLEDVVALLKEPLQQSNEAGRGRRECRAQEVRDTLRDLLRDDQRLH